MQKNIEFAGVNPETFKQLGGRLASLCREHAAFNNGMKLVAAFSDRDPGRGNGILWLAKYFGRFPIEMGGPNGELDLPDLARVSLQSHLTLLIQSIPLYEAETSETDRGFGRIEGADDLQTSAGNLRHHVPIVKGLKDSQAKASVELFAKQIGAFGQMLTNDKKELNGPIIYLAGFSLPNDLECNEHLPSSRFIPWHLLVGDNNRVQRITRQPELTVFLQKFPVANPSISDFDAIINDMDKDANCEWN